MITNSLLDIKTEVAEALAKNKPVLALESTIISHGLPYPQNMEVALELEEIARKNGVVPATICLMNGRIKVGITKGELEILATAENVEKVSRRDFGYVLALKKIGATTVAGTMVAAKLAGINVFATGGIGGVHRQAEESFDISADLIEFSQTPVIVISAGVKAILDIPKTLEFLETYGVPVYGYKTSSFPAFYSVDSGSEVASIDNAAAICAVYRQNRKYGLNQGILIANPIPQDYEIPYKEMRGYIEKALQQAKYAGISGKKVTPFLLKELVAITKGSSLSANLALVKNNVNLASEIAVELIRNV